MRALLQPLSRLQWKLTLTYTLVTTAAVLVVMLAPIVWALRPDARSEQLPRLFALDMRRSADELAPLLEGGPQDIAQVRVWIQQSALPADHLIFPPDQAMARPAQPVPQPLPGGGMVPGTITTSPVRLRYFNSPTFIVLVDAAGNVIASNGDVPAGQSFPAQRYPTAGVLISKALTGETDPARLTSQDPGLNQLYVGSPILSENSQVLGAVIRTIPLPTNQPGFLAEIVRILLPLSLVVLLVVGAVGTVFGYFTSRWLTARLDRLTLAANQWSQGDFATQAVDGSADELGQLAARLNRMAGQLQRLVTTREVLAALEERNRLARDVHDSVKQEVFAISMNLGAAQALWNTDTDSARSRLDDAAALAQQTQQELTAIIQTLRAAPLEEKGLAQALWEAVRAWEKGTGIPVTDEIRITAPLPQAVEQAVFRITQEALANIARHSKATSASLRLTTADGKLRLQITDNGQGFDLSQPSDGLGLRSMRERVSQLGGQLEIRSHKGTSLTAVIPLPLEAA